MKPSFKIVQSTKTFFSTFFTKDEGDYTNPIRDWTLGLFFAIFLFFTGILFIALDFYSQFGISMEAVAPEKKPEVYRDKEVKMFAEKYAEKQKIFNELRAEIVMPTPAVPTPDGGEPAPQPIQEPAPQPEQTADVPLAVDD